VIDTIQTYLADLRTHLVDCDQATLQDALSDSEEHLRTALAEAGQENNGKSEVELLQDAIEAYGTPEELAAAYKGVEDRLTPSLATHRPYQQSSFFKRFFGVFVDSRTWGSLIYLLISIVTGVLYITWAVTGLSLSIGLLPLIIGLPFVGFFLLSLRGIALVEGRLVEALLGVRMPRRPIFTRNDLSLWERLKYLLSDGNTWKILSYLILQLPLGVFYFCLLITLIFLGLAILAIPILQTIFHLPVEQMNGVQYFLPAELYLLTIILGVLILTGTMHLTKILGKFHGWLARTLLISK
jgi:hypothetical protein